MTDVNCNTETLTKLLTLTLTTPCITRLTIINVNRQKKICFFHMKTLYYMFVKHYPYFRRELISYLKGLLGTVDVIDLRQQTTVDSISCLLHIGTLGSHGKPCCSNFKRSFLSSECFTKLMERIFNTCDFEICLKYIDIFGQWIFTGDIKHSVILWEILNNYNL